MKPIVHRFAQRTPEWFAIRAGRVTGSRASDMLARNKGPEEAASRRDLRVQLMLERITGKPQERQFMSAAMQHGADTEAEAAREYEILTGDLLTYTGFVAHPTLLAGCSLDSHVGDFDGIVEIKCPKPATHLGYIRNGKVPGDYLKQVTHGLWVTGAAWCDWMSYEPSFPLGLRSKIVRVQRADLDLAAYERLLIAFLAEVDAEVQSVQQLVEGASHG